MLLTEVLTWPHTQHTQVCVHTYCSSRVRSLLLSFPFLPQLSFFRSLLSFSHKPHSDHHSRLRTRRRNLESAVAVHHLCTQSHVSSSAQTALFCAFQKKSPLYNDLISSSFFPELISTHEFEKKELEENFEKLRLSLQVRVSFVPWAREEVSALCSLANIYLTPTVYWNMEIHPPSFRIWSSPDRTVGKKYKCTKKPLVPRE